MSPELIIPTHVFRRRITLWFKNIKISEQRASCIRAVFSAVLHLTYRSPRRDSHDLQNQPRRTRRLRSTSQPLHRGQRRLRRPRSLLGRRRCAHAPSLVVRLVVPRSGGRGQARQSASIQVRADQVSFWLGLLHFGSGFAFWLGLCRGRGPVAAPSAFTAHICVLSG